MGLIQATGLARERAPDKAETPAAHGPDKVARQARATGPDRAAAPAARGPDKAARQVRATAPDRAAAPAARGLDKAARQVRETAPDRAAALAARGPVRVAPQEAPGLGKAAGRDKAQSLVKARALGPEAALAVHQAHVPAVIVPAPVAGQAAALGPLHRHARMRQPAVAGLPVAGATDTAAGPSQAVAEAGRAATTGTVDNPTASDQALPVGQTPFMVRANM